MAVNAPPGTHLSDERPRGDIEAQQHLPLQKDTKPSFARHLAQDVSTNHADLVFLACYFLSGLCDSSAYRAWGCFVSMQTGNTVFLGLGASDALNQESYHWLKALVSITSFIVGSTVYSKTRYLGAQRRRTLIVNFSSQFLLLAIAAFLLQAKIIEDSDVVTNNDIFLKLIPLSLVAFQCAGQMAASRLLSFPEIPTTVLTSLYYDLFSDPGLLQPLSANAKRNRRATAVIAVVGGAITGGWLAKSTGGISTALWVAAASKIGISMLWMFWKQDESKAYRSSAGS